MKTIFALLILFNLLQAHANPDDIIKFKASAKVLKGKLELLNTQGQKVTINNNETLFMSNHSPLRRFNFKRTWNYDRDLVIELENNQKIIFEIPGELINIPTAEYSVHKDFTGQPAHIVRANVRKNLTPIERETTEDCVADKYCPTFGFSVNTGYSATIKQECPGKRKIIEKVQPYELIRTWRIYNQNADVMISTTVSEKNEETKKIKELSVCEKTN